MPKVLVATEKPFAPAAVKQIESIIKDAGFDFDLLEKYGSKSDLLSKAGTSDAIIIRSDIIDQEVIDSSDQLKIVVRAGAGYDNVDTSAASNKGVVVMNTPGQNSNAVAELALGIMVYMARNKYNGTAGGELKGKTLGIHAYGYIGKLVGGLAKSFGMKVIAFDPFVDAEKIKADGVEAVSSVEELYSKSNYLSLHIPATAKTKESINYELLSKMPEGATLINTARKEVINESEMEKLLADRPDFKYATDIKPGNDEVLTSKFPNQYYSTPKKMGAQTAEANINAGVAAAKQIVGFLKDGDKTFQVN